jgi:hypothetical protein
VNPRLVDLAVGIHEAGPQAAPGRHCRVPPLWARPGRFSGRASSADAMTMQSVSHTCVVSTRDRDQLHAGHDNHKIVMALTFSSSILDLPMSSSMMGHGNVKSMMFGMPMSSNVRSACHVHDMQTSTLHMQRTLT